MVGSLETRYTELLAIHIDYCINFSGHVSELCRKVSKKVGILMCLHNLFPCLAKLTIYKYSILPYLIYCHLVWCFGKPSTARKWNAFKNVPEEQYTELSLSPTRHY